MLPRLAAETIQTLRQGFPILAITGPRQSGKTTLAQACFDGYEYLNLEDLDLREEAEGDPRRFLTRRKSGSILDEAQRAKQLIPETWPTQALNFGSLTPKFLTR